MRRATWSTRRPRVGAAIVGGVGVGIFDDFDVAPPLLGATARHAPDPDRTAGYRRKYELFLDAYRRLEPWFDLI